MTDPLFNLSSISFSRQAPLANPTTGEVTLDLSAMKESPHTLRLFSAERKELLRRALSTEPEKGTFILNINQMPPGVYPTLYTQLYAP